MSLKINDNIDLPNSITAHNRISLKSVSVGGGSYETATEEEIRALFST